MDIDAERIRTANRLKELEDFRARVEPMLAEMLPEWESYRAGKTRPVPSAGVGSPAES